MQLAQNLVEHSESPGTKAYSFPEARQLFTHFTDLKISTPFIHGDLLASDVGQQHRVIALNLAKALWPRWFILCFMPNAELCMLIEARK